MSTKTFIEVLGNVVFSFTRSVSEQYSPEDSQYKIESFEYVPLQRTGQEWHEEPGEEIIYQEYSDREATVRDFLPSCNLNVRLIDACSTEDLEIEETQDNQENEDKAMAWKQLRPSPLCTVFKSMYTGVLVSLLSAVFVGALYITISYLSYKFIHNCQFHPKKSIPVNIQWVKTISDVISCAFIYVWFFSNILVLFRPRQLIGIKKKLFLVCLFGYCLDTLYRVSLQAMGFSKSILSTPQLIPLNITFVISVFWQICILTNHFCAPSRKQKLTVFMQISAASCLPFVLGIIIASWIYPAYNKQDEEGKLITSLFSPLLGVALKTLARISVQRLWSITHPAYSYIMIAPLYCGTAVIFRVLQADLDSLQTIALLGIIHGAAEVIERSTVVAIDHICHVICKRSSVPWGSFRTPRSERLMADIAIMSMLFESTAIVSVNGFFYLYQFIYMKQISLPSLMQSFAISTSVPLVIEWFFTSLSLAIETRYQNMAVMAVWRRHWKRHILVACINAIPVAIWTSSNLLLVVHARFQQPLQQLPCKMPFS